MPAVATRGIVGKPYTDTYQAAAANQLRGLALVQGANDYTAATAAAANALAIGVQAETTVFVGDPVSAVILGEATAIAGAAVAAGQYVVTNAAGQFVPSAAVGDNVVGRACSSAAVAGDEFVIFVNPFIR
jgi:hypothetical protein